MKRKEKTQLLNKSVAELAKELTEKRARVTTLLLERRVKQVKNVREAKMLKIDIARILTLLQLKKGMQSV